jgi:hypothetical protein
MVCINACACLLGLLSEELHELLAWQGTLKGRGKVQPMDRIGQPYPADSALPPVVFAFLVRSLQSFLNPDRAFMGYVTFNFQFSTSLWLFLFSASFTNMTGIRRKKKKTAKKKKKNVHQRSLFYVRALPSNCLRMRWN